MSKFNRAVLRFVLPIFIPLLLASILYLIYDPFKVIRRYSDYSHPKVALNRDFVTTQQLINNLNSYKPDSYIFGSSRTIAFKPLAWKKHLRDTSKVYVYDAFGETLHGIHLKLKFLKESHLPIKNALIILDRDLSFKFVENEQSHLFIKHYLLSRKDKVWFHLVFFKAYFNPMFWISFYTKEFTGQYHNWMNSYVLNSDVLYDTKTSELIDSREQLIQIDSLNYYRERSNQFYSREFSTTDSLHRINTYNENILSNIKKILEDAKCNYKIIMSPLYDQINLSIADRDKLIAIFGDRFYDFSGKNKYTERVWNYYENSHYRPSVGNAIMDSIYNNN